MSNLDDARRGDALRACRGPLLPQSEAPGVVRRRDRLERQLRAAVLSAGQLDLLAARTRSHWGADDLDMWRMQARLAEDGTRCAASRCWSRDGSIAGSGALRSAPAQINPG